jgi:hypothetical protein
MTIDGARYTNGTCELTGMPNRVANSFNIGNFLRSVLVAHTANISNEIVANIAPIVPVTQLTQLTIEHINMS